MSSIQPSSIAVPILGIQRPAIFNYPQRGRRAQAGGVDSGLLDRLRLVRTCEPFPYNIQGFIHLQRMRQRE